MRQDIQLEGYPAQLDFAPGHSTYHVIVPVLSEEGRAARFPHLDAATAAIKKYDLELRKGFRNPTAYTLDRAGVHEVTVTSITSDGQWAWIRCQNGQREKALLGRLYANRVEAQAIVDRERESREEIEAMRDAAKRWQPEFESRILGLAEQEGSP